MLELSGSGEFSFADEISVVVPYVAILMQTLAEAVEEAGKLGRVEGLLDCERQALAERAFLGHKIIYNLVTRLAAETIKENWEVGNATGVNRSSRTHFTTEKVSILSRENLENGSEKSDKTYNRTLRGSLFGVWWGL